jgi:hypothetical protein
MNAKKIALWGYVGVAILTLAFEIFVRAQQCAGASDCALSFAKGIVWSLIWPAGWIVYLKGIL